MDSCFFIFYTAFRAIVSNEAFGYIFTLKKIDRWVYKASGIALERVAGAQEEE